MKILIAPDKFKDALDANRVADAIRAGLLESAKLSASMIDICPLADGGEGSGALVARAIGAIEQRALVQDALGRTVEARWWRDFAGGRAYIEAAEAVGLWRIPAAQRDALRASSFGVGELLRGAIVSNLGKIALFVGGTANVDGGAGCLQALGWTLRDAAGNVIAVPACGNDLEQIASISPPAPGDGAAALRERVDLEVCTDVRNPLIGPDGAVPVFAPQKGAHTPGQLARLSRGMENWAAILGRFASKPIANTAGIGAAGGIPAALLAAFPKAYITAGAARIAELVGFDRRLAAATLCITGEGRLDAQTGFGKVVSFVASRGAARGVPVIALVGAAEPPASVSLLEWGRSLGLQEIVQITPSGTPLDAALAATTDNLRAAAGALVAPWTDNA